MCVPSNIATLRDQLEQTIQMDFPGYKWLSSEQKFIYWNHQTRLLTMQLHISYTMFLKHIHVLTNASLASFVINIIIIIIHRRYNRCDLIRGDGE